MLLLTGSAGADTPIVLTFSGEYSSPSCGPPYAFTVPSGITTIDVAATTDVPANDITLSLYQGSTLIYKQDTLTSPEAIHYAPDGGVAAGSYSVVVCPFADNPQVPPETYHGTVTLSSAPQVNPPLVGPPPAERIGPPAAFDASSGIAFGPSTLVSAHFLCGEPQETLERGVADSQAGAISNNRIFADCPLTWRSQTSLLSRSTDGGSSFRLLLDPTCPQRNRPNCMTLGGGDSEEDVNLVTGNLFFADQEGLTVQEGLASSTDHGDSFPATRQFAITNSTTATDRQWLAWVDPRNATIAGQGLEGFFTWHLPGAGQYVLGIGPNGIPLPQPAPQIPNVGQSGQPRVDNGNTSPGRGYIYQPYGGYIQNPGIWVASAFGPAYQDPTAWQEVRVSPDTRALFPWVAVDGGGNVYLVWVRDDGQLFLSISPIADPRNDPRQGGRPGTYWTGQTQMNAPSIHSTAFPEVIAGANGRIALAYMGSPDCAVGASDNCAPSSHWNVYVDFLTNALPLAGGQSPQISVAQVNHRVAHLGTVCTSGTTCSGDRSLFDMMDVSYDSSGRAAVVFMDNNNALGNASDTVKNSPFVEFAKEVSPGRR